MCWPSARGVDVVERRAGVEQVDPAAGPATPPRPAAPAAGAVSSAAPSTIAASTTWPRPLACRSLQRGEDADEAEHRAAAEVAEQVQRRTCGGPPARPVRVQRAGHRDVVDVVAGRRRPAGRPGPSRSSGRRPARGLTAAAVLRAEPEPLGDPGAEALEQHVGPRDQVEHDLPGVAGASGRRRRCGGRGSARRRRWGRLQRPGRPGRSTRSTSAPRSASTIAANGAGPSPASSTTRRPASGPDRVGASGGGVGLVAHAGIVAPVDRPRAHTDRRRGVQWS